MQAIRVGQDDRPLPFPVSGPVALRDPRVRQGELLDLPDQLYLSVHRDPGDRGVVESGDLGQALVLGQDVRLVGGRDPGEVYCPEDGVVQGFIPEVVRARKRHPALDEDPESGSGAGISPPGWSRSRRCAPRCSGSGRFRCRLRPHPPLFQTLLDQLFGQCFIVHCLLLARPYLARDPPTLIPRILTVGWPAATSAACPSRRSPADPGHRRRRQSPG